MAEDIVKFQFRRDTAAGWAASNPILDVAEPGYVEGQNYIKIGDGSSFWNALPGLGEMAIQRIKTVTTTNYTLTLDDMGKLLAFSNIASVTVTVPPASTSGLIVGHRLDAVQFGAGQVNFTGGVGVTIYSAYSYTTSVRFSPVSLVHLYNDEWLLLGDLTSL